MSITAAYDPEADALYLRIAEGERARSVVDGDRLVADVDERGMVIGLEILYPSMGIDLGDVCARFGLQAQIGAIATAIEDAGVPFAAPTYTGSITTTAFTSVTVPIIVSEGNIPAGGGYVPVAVVQHDSYRMVDAEPASLCG